MQKRVRHFSSSPPGFDSKEVLGGVASGSGGLLDPGVIVGIAAAADHAVIVAEASQRWPVISALQYSLEWLFVTTGGPW